MISAKRLLKISGIWQKLLQHLKGMTERKIFFAPLVSKPIKIVFVLFLQFC